MAWRTLISLVLVCLILPGLVAQPVELIASIKEGDASLAAGRPAEALVSYLQAVAYPLGKPIVLQKIAQAKLEVARGATSDRETAYQAAREAWLEVQAVNEIDGTSAIALAEIYLALAQPEVAHGWAAISTGTTGNSAIWRQLAAAHLAETEWELAGQAFSALASAESENYYAHYWAGVLLVSSDMPKARHHLGQVRDVTPYEQPVSNLLTTLNEIEGAVDTPFGTAQLGLTYLNLGEPVLARDYLQATVNQEPSYAEAWAYLGLAQDQSGEDGRRAIAQAIDHEPRNPLPHSLMGHHWLRYDQVALARQSFVVAWELEPENPMRLLDVASTYGLEGDFYSAEAWYQAAIRLEPENALLWVVLAHFHLDTLNDVGEGGMLAARRSVALAPDDPATLDVLGWAQLLAGEIRLAEVNLLAAWDLDRSNPTIGYHLARMYHSLGDRKEAEAFYREVVSLDTFCRLCPAPRQGQYAQLAERALKEMGVQ